MGGDYFLSWDPYNFATIEEWWEFCEECDRLKQESNSNGKNQETQSR